MINNEEKFFNYLNNKMTETEKNRFEDELKSSESLQRDYFNYQTITNIVQETKDIRLNTLYTQTILPKFRERLEKKRKVPFFSKYGFAVAFLFVVVISYSIINNLVIENQNSNNLYPNLTNDEMSYIADKMDLDFSKDLDENTELQIDSMYDEDLSQNVNASLNDNTIQSYSNDLSIKELDNYLSDSDIDLIYSELLKKQIL
jgi:hypothetical protein